MKSRRIVLGTSIGLVLVFFVTGLAFDADFDLSTYNPEVGEIVNFEVCEPCLGGSDFTYTWDFNGDGTAELQTEDTLVTHSFSAAGFHEVVLTVADRGGRTSVARQGVVVGPVPVLGIRELLLESDGAVFVLITVTMAERFASPGIEENIPTGWAVEIVDAGGALARPNMEERQLEIVWMSMFEIGEEITFSYRLRPAYTAVLPTLFGEVSGYAEGERHVVGIAGTLTLPR